MSTPRTDAAEEESIRAYEKEREPGWPPFPCDGYDLARQLERELGEVQSTNNGNLELLSDQRKKIDRLRLDLQDTRAQLTSAKSALEKAREAINKVVMLCEQGMGCAPENRPKWITEALTAINEVLK